MKIDNKILTSVLLLLVVAEVVALNSDSLAASPEEVAAATKEECFSESSFQEKCYANELSKSSQEQGHEYAFDVLFALQKLDPNTIGCHFLSHGIGEGTYKRSPNDWQKNIQAINPACNYGALHGIIENYAASLPGGTLTAEVAATVCGEKPRADCNHIVGHLLLVEADADSEKALGLCEVFQDQRQLEYCYTGVFMEYQTALNLIAHDLVPKSWLDWKARLGEMERMCLDQTDLAAVACWKEISHAADVAFDHDPTKIFEFCEEAQVSEGKKQCKMHSIAILATHLQFDFDKLKPMCEIPQSSDPEFAQECYTRLAITSLYSQKDAMEEVKEYCSTLPARYQKGCFAETDAFNGNKNQYPTTD